MILCFEMSTIKAKNRATILESSFQCAIADEYALKAAAIFFRGAFKYNSVAWVVLFEIFTIFRHFVIGLFVSPIYRCKSFFFCTIGLDVADLNAKLTTKVLLNVFGAV